jgi:hypothetical protein
VNSEVNSTEPEKFDFYVVYYPVPTVVLEPDYTRDEINERILRKITDGYNPKIIGSIRLSSLKNNKNASH